MLGSSTSHLTQEPGVPSSTSLHAHSVAAALALAVAGSACKRAPEEPASVHLSGPADVRDAGSEGQVLILPPVFLSSRISKAPDVVYLLLHGVRFDPAQGGNAEVFIVNAGAAPSELDPKNYVGGVGGLAGQPGPIEVQLEVNDFEANGERFLARTNLRAMAGVSVALRVTQGRVTLEGASLSAGRP